MPPAGDYDDDRHRREQADLREKRKVRTVLLGCFRLHEILLFIYLLKFNRFLGIKISKIRGSARKRTKTKGARSKNSRETERPWVQETKDGSSRS